MSGVNPALIGPIIAMVFLYIKLIFGIEMPAESADITVNGVLGAIGIIGLFIRPKKEKPPN